MFMWVLCCLSEDKFDQACCVNVLTEGSGVCRSAVIHHIPH